MLPGVFAFIGLLNAFTPAANPKLSYSTYLPGPDAAYTAVDSAGDQYFSFESTSACDAPPTYAPPRPVLTVFVGKLASEGREVTWVTCLPGRAGVLLFDRVDALHVATTSGEASTVTKLAPGTFKPIYATILNAASVSALALDRSDRAYATGSAVAGLRTTPGAYRETCSSPVCGFVARFEPTGAVGFVTYLPVKANAIAVDSRGQAWITGGSAFVSKLNAEGSDLLVNRGFGGGVIGGKYPITLYARGTGIAIDDDDAAYAVGNGTVAVPTTPGTLLPSNPGAPYNARGYLVKFDSIGNVVYGTYIDSRTVRLVAVDGSGNAYIATPSWDRPPNAGNAWCGWDETTRLTAINNDGSRVLSSRPVGGQVSSLARHPSGAVYVSGNTRSTAFVGSAGAYKSEFTERGQAAFAAKIDFSQPATPALTCVVNAASRWAGRNAFSYTGAVAPGEVVTLYGEMFTGGEDVGVTFDGVPAPVLHSGVSQIDAVVPFRTGEQGDFTKLSIRFGSEVIGPYRLPVSRAVPGLFTISRNGSATVAALNQDGSVNSIASPAPAGSAVAVYVTGAGLFDREMQDGSLGPMEPPFPASRLGVRAVMGRSPRETVDAPVLFAGQAPGLIAGVVQVILRIPEKIESGPAFLGIFFGDYSTPMPMIFVASK